MGKGWAVYMVDVKCQNCGRVLMKCTIFVGAIKCRHCKKIFEYRVLSSSMEISNAHTIQSIATTENIVDSKH